MRAGKGARLPRLPLVPKLYFGTYLSVKLHFPSREIDATPLNVHPAFMSTLDEIESTVQKLPRREQELLFLPTRQTSGREPELL